MVSYDKKAYGIDGVHDAQVARELVVAIQVHGLLHHVAGVEELDLGALRVPALHLHLAAEVFALLLRELILLSREDLQVGPQVLRHVLQVPRPVKRGVVLWQRPQLGPWVRLHLELLQLVHVLHELQLLSPLKEVQRELLADVTDLLILRHVGVRQSWALERVP